MARDGGTMACGCGKSGTLHDDWNDGPGVIPAVGPERRGAGVRVRTERGMETVRVLIARIPGGWRARIVSDPNVLWTARGGRTTLKFLGDSPEDVEQRAIAFIEEHCARRWPGGPAETPGRTVVRMGAAVHPPRGLVFTSRKPVRLPVRYGDTRASDPGTTANLSAEGMFIESRRPLSPGTPLTIRMEIGGATVEVSGLVMWSRRGLEPGRPAGMGVRLLLPPPAYGTFVDSLS